MYRISFKEASYFSVTTNYLKTIGFVFLSKNIYLNVGEIREKGEILPFVMGLFTPITCIKGIYPIFHGSHKHDMNDIHVHISIIRILVAGHVCMCVCVCVFKKVFSRY